ncbi:MAG: PHP domain-containing protein [Thermotogota bacterium]
MAIFNCSFHNHTVLSPCADITMTADLYKKHLTKSNINWIAITDHNSTKNIKPFINYFKTTDIKIIPGIEVETAEEIHIVVLFEKMEESILFGKFIEDSLTIKEYNPEKFGYQIILNDSSEFDSVLEKPYLGSSSKYSINKVVHEASKYKTIIFPAHIFRAFGLITQLGIPPKDLYFDAVEVKKESEIIMAKKLGFHNFIFGNDTHTPDQLYSHSCEVEANSRSFDELKKAIKNKKVYPKWQH